MELRAERGRNRAGGSGRRGVAAPGRPALPHGPRVGAQVAFCPVGLVAPFRLLEAP